VSRASGALFTAIAIFVSSACLGGIVGPKLLYRGRILLDRRPFNGSALFKLAFIDAKGTKTYWSNDGTSVAAAEPENAIPLSVVDGAYTVVFEEQGTSNMLGLPAGVLKQPKLRLRIWCNLDNTGFRRLAPDEAISPDSRVIVGKAHASRSGVGAGVGHRGKPKPIFERLGAANVAEVSPTPFSNSLSASNWPLFAENARQLPTPRPSGGHRRRPRQASS
jgi:hypothetical protein